MKIHISYLAHLLLVAAAAPTSAKCERLLPYYLKNPMTATAPGTDLAGTQFAIVKIAAIHPNSKPHLSHSVTETWHETGTLDLVKIESRGKSLPVTFSVPYNRRMSFVVDRQTWDRVVLKPGERLLAFFRPENKGWVVPELAAPDIILDADQLAPADRKAIQPLFRTRL